VFCKIQKVLCFSHFCLFCQHTKAVSMGHLIGESCYKEALHSSGKVPEVIRFYDPKAENGWLSNFYSCQIEIAGG
jgi:hypothetical protein